MNFTQTDPGYHGTDGESTTHTNLDKCLEAFESH